MRGDQNSDALGQSMVHEMYELSGEGFFLYYLDSLPLKTEQEIVTEIFSYPGTRRALMQVHGEKKVLSWCFSIELKACKGSNCWQEQRQQNVPLEVGLLAHKVL